MTRHPRGAGTHRLDEHHFDALARGGGDEETVSRLLAVERSWRMLQLRAVLDSVAADPEVTGPLDSVRAAWDLLVEAERHAPAEVDALLLHPQVGTWAGYTLRRLRRGSPGPEALWTDVGYLHSIAAAAAIRAGLDFTIRVAARDGFAVLPTLGGVDLRDDDAGDTVAVTGSAGDATFKHAAGEVVRPRSGKASPGWFDLPVVHAGEGDLALSVTLDSLDPYRNLRTPTPAERLSPAREERWRSLLTQGWHLLVDVCPHLARPIARGLFSVVPQPAAERFRTMSASAGDAFGSLMMSEPRDETEVAVTLVHEFQHIKLGGLLHLAPLHDGEPEQRLYAPWRDDPRPLGGLLQGVYAFVGIVEFWRAMRGTRPGPVDTLAQFEFARWREQVSATLAHVGDLPYLTPVGRRLVAGLAATAAGWQAEPVPADVLAAARAANADHRLLWRAHHLRPDPATVATLATAFVAGAAGPIAKYPEPVVDADPGARRLDTRAVLTLARFIDRGSSDGAVSGATTADVAYVSGDRDASRDLYLAELAEDPPPVSAWGGLALAEDAPPEGSLRRRPELVRAVHAAARRSTGKPVDPRAVIAWLDNKGAERTTTASR